MQLEDHKFTAWLDRSEKTGSRNISILTEHIVNPTMSKDNRVKDGTDRN